MGRAEKQALAAMFGLFGFGVMTLGPRMPDIKYNLGVSNGTFGIILSSGSIGALVSLLTMGHIVHRIGVKSVLLVSTFTMYGTLAIMVHLHNPVIYLILNL
ncbi:MAG: MFS transporter, partial [Actinobacteria bacterium]|nr:MFS transporter [Actinomycetota bacterium]